MAEENTQRGNIYSANDALDINELASLNDDISPEFIEQLQNKIAINANKFTGREFNPENNDGELFEEVSATASNNIVAEPPIEDPQSNANTELPTEPEKKDNEKDLISEDNAKDVQPNTNKLNVEGEIENLTSGNIIERPATQKQIDYNNSLDYVDDNTKYSKYIIYINPENTEFIADLHADSVDVATIICDIEDEFNIEIEEEQLEGIETVGDVVVKIEAMI